MPFPSKTHDWVGDLAALENVDQPGRIRGDSRDASEIPAFGHGVRGLEAEPDLHAVLHQAAFVWIPALLVRPQKSGEARHQKHDLFRHYFSLEGAEPLRRRHGGGSEAALPASHPRSR